MPGNVLEMGVWGDCYSVTLDFFIYLFFFLLLFFFYLRFLKNFTKTCEFSLLLITAIQKTRNLKKIFFKENKNALLLYITFGKPYLPISAPVKSQNTPHNIAKGKLASNWY